MPLFITITSAKSITVAILMGTGTIVQAIDTTTTGTVIKDTENVDTKYTVDIMGTIATITDIMAIITTVSAGVEDKSLQLI